ncbi:cytochrome c biogenesis protein [Leptolyngbya boryana CZ1]|jgi:cytochrome c biogenesis protein|uniref:Cytochrome c biogenesis protein CcsB n=2 Tax=Leptolyngbya boryana TaxID=1184 RepID=A0A1Z4JNT2_LEPBY|nr:MULTISPECIES: cytochrome c biogenesis protein [Leptolyngbya]BAY58389.1 cytochrome c biogenesis protein ccs1 [Leptolyngbya boryana NIES-2135]MBD1858938.1 cytochrome c biogenesis protein [Leptolyngbya sp. FACHB-1624]MBD2368063.1 cytochrome c biogenesis protein [Leptolyngbya sp. FACHB-161]MBD2374587.1 cytochrome c biogenesis protein [Leptolyngbya sp. FACHB-238]MBD2399009.1 cytochrome c biogenesis protein [Leptolyngbya sp. FACHB-239]
MTFTELVNAPKRYLKKELLPVLADLRLAIVLLLAIAVFSIAGTIIEQGQSVQFYQANYPEKPALFGFLTWKVLLTAGLDHVYRTWWYLALLILFGASLTACTFTRQLPALRWFSRTWNFYSQPRQFRKFALSAEFPKAGIDQLLPLLEQRKYKIFQDGDKLYAHKGIVGRIGPIVVHAAMLLILLGGIIGAMTGFIAQEMVPSGATFQIDNVTDAGIWAAPQIPKDWSVKVNRFWIDYLPTGEIDQFYSDLSVLDQNGKEVDRKTIHVNEPLKHKGVTLYQADWSIAAIQVRLNNSPVLQSPMARIDQGSGRIWGTWLPLKPDMSDGVSLVAKDLQGLLLVYDMDGKLIATVRKGMAVDVKGLKLSIVDLIGSTGLQIKADPGIPIVYLGFGLLMLGVIMSYVSHSQIWGLEKDGAIYIGGRTNRAQVTFEREFLGILEAIDQGKSESTPTQLAQT